MENLTIQMWLEIAELVAGLAHDVRKSSGGNSSAGVRTRKGLRKLKNLAAALTKHSVELDKHRKASKVEDKVEVEGEE